MAEQVAAITAGAAASYLLGVGLGVAPPLIGEDNLRDFSRQKWGKHARKVLDELDANWSYMLLKPKGSNRNFVSAQPEETRVKFVSYVSPFERKMRGVAKFGLCTERHRGCICGGAVAAAADQILGMYAISMMFFPVVTANLDVKFLESIPLGSELGFVCKMEEGSDSIKKLIVTLRFYSLNPDDQKKDLVVVTGIFVNSILPNFIKSML